MANVNSTTFARPEFTGFINPVSFPAGADAAPDGLLTRPLNGGDLLTLAPVCAELVAWLLETPDTTTRLALAGRLVLALSLLRDGLNTPLTQAQRDALTTREPSAVAQVEFVPESEMLCDYCHTLTGVLLSRTLTAAGDSMIAGLLFELVNHLADSLTAPRFYHAADGLRYLDDGSRVEAEDEHSCV
ncbi:hypothetical protein [Atlantibacter sp.]|uniref:hypothetical protein n=1 Tax=Atlantibacter sp. TaxID=1903473 RepID=UPI0028B089CF|nr:hypothetical protein [Atlantibacter sp.]